MRKISLVFAFFLMLPLLVQCTDEEDVEAAVHQSRERIYISGEEGADDVDMEKDE